MTQPQQIKNGRMDVIHVVRFFLGAQSKFVCRADGLAAFDSATGHPHRECNSDGLAGQPSAEPLCSQAAHTDNEQYECGRFWGLQ